MDFLQKEKVLIIDIQNFSEKIKPQLLTKVSNSKPKPKHFSNLCGLK